MTYKEFVELVIEMRQAQRNYFKNRTQGDLTNSKRLEKLIDTVINSEMWLPDGHELQKIEKEQDLFSEIRN